MNKKYTIQEIPDDALLYKYKNYKKGLELINDNVPLNIVKRRLHNRHMIEMSEDVRKYETKKINRKCAIIDAKLKQRAFKVFFVDPKSDIVCEKCQYNPNYHPVGCN